MVKVETKYFGEVVGPLMYRAICTSCGWVWIWERNRLHAEEDAHHHATYCRAGALMGGKL